MRLDSRRPSPLGTPLSETQSLVSGMHMSDTQSTLGMPMSDTEAVYMARTWKKDYDLLSPQSRDRDIVAPDHRSSSTTATTASIRDLQTKKTLPRPKAKPTEEINRIININNNNLPVNRSSSSQMAAATSTDDIGHSDASEASEASDMSKTSTPRAQAQTKTLRYLKK